MYKMLKFIHKYCGIDDLLNYNSQKSKLYMPCVIMFAICYRHNLWLSSYEEFLKGQYFGKKDVELLVFITKEISLTMIEVLCHNGNLSV